MVVVADVLVFSREGDDTGDTTRRKGDDGHRKKGVKQVPLPSHYYLPAAAYVPHLANL